MGEFRVDLIADGQPDRAGCGEVSIVAAGIKRDGKIEQRLAGFQGDGGATGLWLSDTGHGGAGGFLRGMLGAAATAAGLCLCCDHKNESEPERCGDSQGAGPWRWQQRA